VLVLGDHPVAVVLEARDVVGWAFHQTGAVRRSSANSSRGTRSCVQVGSVKSNPSGRVVGVLIGSSFLRRGGASIADADV
jgi:hypothetical protein